MFVPVRRLAILFLLATTACSAMAAPGASSPDPTLSPTPSAPGESVDPSAPASPLPTIDPDAPHPAEGLTLVALPNAGNPVSQLYVVDDEGELQQVSDVAEPTPHGVGAAVWSPDGTRIAFMPSRMGGPIAPTVYLMNADGTQQRVIDELGAEEFSLPAWSADGASLIYSDSLTTGEPRMWRADLASGEVVQIGIGSRPRWLPGHREIGYLRAVQGLVADDPLALTLVVYTMGVDDLAPEEFARASNAVWSPDGSQVVVEVDGRLLLTDAAGGNARELARGFAPVWSPDGTRVAYGHGVTSDGESMVAVIDTDGHRIWSDVIGTTPVWSPDGTHLAIADLYPDQLVKVLDAATGAELWQVAGTQPTWRP